MDSVIQPSNNRALNFDDEANNVQLDKEDTQLKQLEYLSVTLVLIYPGILLFVVTVFN